MEPGVHHRALLRRQVADRTRNVEERAVGREPQRVLVGEPVASRHRHVHRIVEQMQQLDVPRPVSFAHHDAPVFGRARAERIMRERHVQLARA